MINRLMIAGFGGQGVMMIGKLIGECAMEQGLYATFFPSYGAEQRGGTANCTVIQSDRMIGSPTSNKLDVLCALNQPSMVDFLPRLRPGGTLLVNISIVDTSGVSRDDIQIVKVDIDNMAYELGNRKVANVIMFAAYMALTNTIPADKAEEIAMHKLGRKPELIELNRRAFRAGMDVIEKLKEAGECR